MSADVARIPPIAGRYHVAAGPFIGGMSEVYKAYDLHNEHDHVAVKLMPGGTSPHVRSLHYDREREALRRLDHPAIVALLDSGDDDGTGRPFLVFPWMERSLTDELQSRGSLGWDDWWSDFGEPILGACEEAHRHNVHHRDLKPANVRVNSDGHPVVIDFGISRMLDELASDATVDGASAPFTPPELVAHSPGMSRDTHAWAALTVFALSGHDAYAANPADPYERLERARIAASAQLPGRIGKIVEDCLSTNPALRPHNATVLAAKVNNELEAVARQAARLGTQSAAIVHVRPSSRVVDQLSRFLDCFESDVAELLQAELDGQVHVVGPDERPRLVTDTFSLRTAVDSQKGELALLGAARVNPEVLDRDRATGWPATVRFWLGSPPDPHAGANAIRTLQQFAAEHRQATEHSTTKRPHPFRVWRTLLSLLRAHEAAGEDPRAYRGASIRDGTLHLTLVEPPPQAIVGEDRVLTGIEGRDYFAVVTRIRDTHVWLHPDPRNTDHPLTAGVLRRDEGAAMTAIDRQQRALDAIEYGRCVRPSLKPLLIDPARAREPRPAALEDFKQPLDGPKQAAVRSALGSQDILIVRGPPGTGKTRFITELVLQELERNPGSRILLASQTHAALDNALAGIRSVRDADELLRIARADDPKVDPDVISITINERLAQWKREAVAAGRAELKRWATAQQIDVHAIDAATRLATLAASVRERHDLQRQRTETQVELEELRGGSRDLAQSATVAQLVRDRTEEIDEIRGAHELLDNQIKEQVAGLVDIGHLKRGTAISKLDADELSERARRLVPDDTSAAEACRRRLSLLTDWHARFGTGAAFQAAALAKARVVAATCVGLGGVRGADGIEFDLVIVDEASKATAPELLIPASRGRRLVLVGDDRQLPPYVEQDALDEEQIRDRGLTKDALTASMFTYLAGSLPEANVRSLTRQHRMHPAIGRLVSDCFYDQKLVSEPRETATWLDIIAPRPVCWLTTSHLAKHTEERAGTSWINRTEIEIVADFLGRTDVLAKAAKKRPTVAVLAGYKAQRDAIEERLGRDRPRWKSLDIECQTVDAYQGREADIVLYSVTRSNARRKLGFVRDPPRLNVALSRPHDALVIVGDHVFARDAFGADAFRRVLDHIDAHPDDCQLMEPPAS